MSDAFEALSARWRVELDQGANRQTFFEREIDGYRDAVGECVDRLILGPLFTFGTDIMGRARERGLSPDEARAHLNTFLASDHARRVPANWLAGHLWADVAWSVANGNQRAARPSSAHDIEFISAYLPYLDAVLVDRFFFSVLRQEPLRTEIEAYPCRIFSVVNLSELLEFLDEVEAAVSDEQRRTVRDVYGDEWLHPYRKVIVDARERDAKRDGGSQSAFDSDLSPKSDAASD